MLELRTYTKDEIAGILGTTDRQGIKRKLDGYGVEYPSTDGAITRWPSPPSMTHSGYSASPPWASLRKQILTSSKHCTIICSAALISLSYRMK